MIRSGWGKFWGDRKRYFGTDDPGRRRQISTSPGLSTEAAEFLGQTEGAIKAVGIDTPSIDHGPSREFATHQLLGAANLSIFENVANLDRLPAKNTTIYAIPMKIKGGSGAPLRIFAYPALNSGSVAGVSLAYGWGSSTLISFCIRTVKPIKFSALK